MYMKFQSRYYGFILILIILFWIPTDIYFASLVRQYAYNEMLIQEQVEPYVERKTNKIIPYKNYVMGSPAGKINIGIIRIVSPIITLDDI